MAKLSARGRFELVRMSKVTIPPDMVKCGSCEGHGTYQSDLDSPLVAHKSGDACKICEGTGTTPSSTTWERTTIALMSDRKILSKWDVRFRADNMYPNGRPHSYGWNVRGKAKAGVDAAKFREIYLKAGYTEEKTRI